MITLELAGNTARMNVSSTMVIILLRRKLLKNHLILNLAMRKKKRFPLLRQMKSYIDNNLNPMKVNVIDPSKDNFTQPLSVKEILDELEIS